MKCTKCNQRNKIFYKEVMTHFGYDQKNTQYNVILCMNCFKLMFQALCNLTNLRDINNLVERFGKEVIK